MVSTEMFMTTGILGPCMRQCGGAVDIIAGINKNTGAKIYSVSCIRCKDTFAPAESIKEAVDYYLEGRKP
jgi:hypothetical protein